MKKVILIILAVINFNAMAQLLSGPVVECVDCEQYKAVTEPLNGLWWNPEQSGVGYTIEVQNGKVFGVYYGYDQAKKPLWLTFFGELKPSSNSEIMWTLDSELKQFEGGTCLNCEYQAPNGTETQSVIHIDFKHKNYASFSVNDGAAQNIVPFVFGVPTSADFVEQTSFLFPDMYGTWSFTFHLNPDEPPYLPNQWGYTTATFQINHKFEPGDRDNNGKMEVQYIISNYYPAPEIQIIGEIKCENKNVGDTTPSCYFILGGFLGKPSETFHFPLGGLGASRIFGESENGHTFEAVKIDSTEYLSKKQ